MLMFNQKSIYPHFILLYPLHNSPPPPHPPPPPTPTTPTTPLHPPHNTPPPLPTILHAPHSTSPYPIPPPHHPTTPPPHHPPPHHPQHPPPHHPTPPHSTPSYRTAPILLNSASSCMNVLIFCLKRETSSSFWSSSNNSVNPQMFNSHATEKQRNHPSFPHPPPHPHHLLIIFCLSQTFALQECNNCN